MTITKNDIHRPAIRNSDNIIYFRKVVFSSYQFSAIDSKLQCPPIRITKRNLRLSIVSKYKKGWKGAGQI